MDLYSLSTQKHTHNMLQNQNPGITEWVVITSLLPDLKQLIADYSCAPTAYLVERNTLVCGLIFTATQRSDFMLEIVGKLCGFFGLIWHQTYNRSPTQTWGGM